jgi:hypothetical protein
MSHINNDTKAYDVYINSIQRRQKQYENKYC